MSKGVVLFCGLLAVLMATSCNSAPASPTMAAALTRQIVTRAPGAPPETPASTELSSETPAPAPAAASPSVVPPTSIPTSTSAPPTPVIPSGLYATSLDISPDPPKRGMDLEFYATFANTTGVVQNFRWIIFIYRPDNPLKSFGQATVTSSSVEIGAQTKKSLGSWRLPLGGPCDNFTARVAWMDQNNQTTPFLRPDGQPFEKNFVVCADIDLPTLTPAPLNQPSPIPTPSAGIFVVDLRTDPNPPTRGSDLIFYPTFSNTTGTVQNYRWIIYIYKTDDPVRRYAETSPLQTAFPVGALEQRSFGSWKLSLGGPCEQFVARVVWFDQTNKVNQFTKSDGAPFEKDMTVCPP